MSGIILLVILVIWFYIVRGITKLIILKTSKGRLRSFISIMVFSLLFIAPVADEIIGGFQFRALCTPENTLSYDPKKIINRSLTPVLPPLYVKEKIVPITVSTIEWRDVVTGELLITNRIFSATGGWLSQLIGFPQGSPPYTFKGKCRSEEYYEMFEKFNITKVEK